MSGARPQRDRVDGRALLRRELIALEERVAPREPFLAWSLGVPEPKRGALNFDRFPFQRELYEQGGEEREMVIKKATQVGVSAHCIRWALYWAEQAQLTALYVFPSQRQLNDFSASRVGPLIAGSAKLQPRLGEPAVQNVGLKRVGGGLLFLRGSESEAALQSIDADVLVLDEYDLLAQEHIPDAEQRLGASEHGLIRRVGVPSFPGVGIAGLYAESDRRAWFVRCGACGLRQPLRFEDNVETEKLIRVCSSCRRELDVREGEWVAEFPDREVRGYHIPRLIVPDLDIAALVRASKARDPSRRAAFFNKHLAEEHIEDNARLSAAVIEAAQADYDPPSFYSGPNLVTMGVDVASKRGLHVRVSEHLAAGVRRALFIGEVDQFSALAELFRRYRVKWAAIDSQPEHLMARGFAARFLGQVYLVNYTGHSARQQLAFDHQAGTVSVSRVAILDETLELFRRGGNILPRSLPPGYARQLQAAIRVIEPDPAGRPRARYQSVGGDDYLHAEAFDLVATKLAAVAEWVRRQSEVEVVPITELLPDFQSSNLDGHAGDEVVYRPFDPVSLRDDYDWY